MSAIDERLRLLTLFYPTQCPQWWMDMCRRSRRSFAPVTKFICPAALARRMVSPFVGRWAGRLAWSKARSPHAGWQLNCWLCSKALWAILITFDES